MRLMPAKGDHVYLAGPMTSAPYTGVTLAVQAAERLRKQGYIPVVPQLCALWSMIGSSATYEEWLAYDFALIDRCDCLLRLPGASVGADREVEYAKERGIPVFHYESEFLR